MVRKEEKIGVIIQARYNSSRLAGKVLLNLPFSSDETVLSQIVRRLRAVKSIDEIIIATSAENDDDPIEDEGKRIGIPVFRGSKENVLDRFIQASKLFDLNKIVRITGDNPIVLTDIIEKGIIIHKNLRCDYTRNIGLPYGASFEIVEQSVIENIANNNPTKEDCEHVTLYIKNNRKDFRINEIKYDFGVEVNALRLTIDYPSDFAMMNILFLIIRGKDYKLEDIFMIFKKYPWLYQINENNYQKKQFLNFSEELPTAIKILENHGLEHTLKRIIGNMPDAK